VTAQEVKHAAVKHVKVAHAIVASIVKKSSDKSVTVLIQRQLRHPFYGKYIRRSSKLHVHDEANEGQVGDVVRIVACRRQSKTKAWRLVEILQSATRKVPATAAAAKTSAAAATPEVTPEVLATPSTAKKETASDDTG